MKLAPLKEYALWLSPEGRGKEKVENFIRDSANLAKTVIFYPHVTLLGEVGMDVNGIIKKMDKLASNTAPFKISFISPDISDQFYKSIFLNCRNSKSLMQLNRQAQELFHKHYFYHPHMSLLYGNIEEPLKNKIIKKINSLIIRSFAFEAESIFLCKAFGTTEEWKVVYKSRFKKIKTRS